MLKSMVAMNLKRIALVIYAMCLQQVWLGDKYTTGYVSRSVVLKSGANQSWILTKIQWSIYPNTTYIASLKNGEILTDRFWRHKGRLELDYKTGDLTIKNLTMNDSMTYSVDLTTSNFRKDYKVQLQVQERLKKPNITQEINYLKDEQCHILLRCNPPDENVQLSWTPSHEFERTYILENKKNESFLWTSFGFNRSVTFNCTAHNVQQSEAQQITVGCTEEIKSVSTCSCSCATVVFLWILCITVVIILLYVCKGNLKACIDPLNNVYQNVFKR